jgi:hypothetical protein
MRRENEEQAGNPNNPYINAKSSVISLRANTNTQSYPYTATDKFSGSTNSNLITYCYRNFATGAYP